MKILMIAPEPFFEPRGTPFSVYQRIFALTELGHSVDLVTYHVGQDVNLPRTRIHRIPNLPWIREVKVGPSWAKPLLDLLLFFKAFFLLLRGNYDVIHSHEEAAFFSPPLAAIFRTRHIYDMHSSLPRQLENFNFGNWRPLVKAFERLERFTIRTCDAVITIGADLEALVRRINPHVAYVTIENLPVGSNGWGHDAALVSALQATYRSQGKQPIIYTGTLEPYQGIQMLLQSMALVVKENPQAHLVLVGGKADQVEQFQAVAETLHLSAHIEFVGIVSPDVAVSYAKAAHILVSPRTTGTSIPLKIYSYLCAGVPILATRIAAHTQLLNDDLAHLVEPTPADMAAGMLALLRDPERRARLGARAVEFAEREFSLETYLCQLHAVYQLAFALPPAVEESASPV